MLRRISAIIQKELIQTMRDRSTLALFLLTPLLQLVLFAYGIHMNIQHIPMVVADQSLDNASRSYMDAMVNSGYFDIVGSVSGQTQAIQQIDEGTASVALVIPPDFASKVDRNQAQVLLLVDGSDPFTTQSAYNAANVIAQAHAVQIVTNNLQKAGLAAANLNLNPLNTHINILYNPDLKDLWFIVPGMIAMLLQTQTIALTALAVVREREAGTIEQILVSPIRAGELMLGKSIPNLIIAMINALTIVAAGHYWFGVPFVGNLWLFFGLALIYVFSGLGLGLMISSVSQNSRQAQQLTMMIVMVGLILGGFIFPQYAMPKVLQWVGYIFPLTYFIPIARGIANKGMGIEFLWGQVAALTAYVVLILILATRVFRQRLD
ncbi:MAG: ABC transporter permease [Chloroflexi bacterium]|nr:ABC transporter permease [Chloroflexota bacterium]